MYRRYHRMPFDVWVCFLLSALVGWGTGTLAEKLAAKAYEVQVERHAPVTGEIGGPAGEDAFRAQSVEDLLSHDTFTVVSPGIEYRNRGAGYYGGRYFYAVTLPSGERVAAWINGDSVQEEGGHDYYSSDKVLPLGRVVYEDLTSRETFLEQIEHSEPLSRRDFYIDMAGAAAVPAQEQALGVPKMVTQIITVAVCFPLFHALGSRLGLWGSYFAPKKREEETWE